MDNKNEDGEDSKGRTALFYAIAHIQIEVLDLLLSDLRVDVNFRAISDGSRGYTAFYFACMLGNPDVVQVFLKHAKNRSIDLNTNCQYGGLTGFSKACRNGHDEVVKMLIYEKEALDINTSILNHWSYKNGLTWAAICGMKIIQNT